MVGTTFDIATFTSPPIAKLDPHQRGWVLMPEMARPGNYPFDGALLRISRAGELGDPLMHGCILNTADIPAKAFSLDTHPPFPAKTSSGKRTDGSDSTGG